MIRLIALAPVLLVAACGTPSAPDSGESRGGEEAATPVASAKAPGTLAGAWRVAAIDGKPLDGDIGIALLGDEREIWWEPRCAGLVVDYRIAGDRFLRAETKVPDPPAETGPETPVSPPPVCALVVPPKVIEAGQALRAADRIERTPENGILLSGQGRSVLLFSQ